MLLLCCSVSALCYWEVRQVFVLKVLSPKFGYEVPSQDQQVFSHISIQNQYVKLKVSASKTEVKFNKSHLKSQL